MAASPADSGSAPVISASAAPAPSPSTPVVPSVDKYNPAAAYARVQAAVRSTGHANADATADDPIAMRRVLAHEVGEREKRDSAMSSGCNHMFMTFDNLELYAALQHAKTLVPEMSLAAVTAPLSSVSAAHAAPVPAVAPASTPGSVPVLQPNGRPAGNRRVALNTVVRGTTPALLRADNMVVAVVPYGLNGSGLRRQCATKTGTTTDGRPYYTIDPTRSAPRHSSPVDWFRKMSLRGAGWALLTVIVAFVLLLIFQPQVYITNYLPRERGLAATILVIVMLWFVGLITYRVAKRRDRDYDNI